MTDIVDTNALKASQAGMRLVAQTFLYNVGKEDRLRQFLSEAYADDLLAQQPADAKTAAFLHMRRVVGRLKIKQVLGIDPHQVVALMQAERLPDGFIIELKVHADYPHKIVYYMQRPLE